MNHLHLWAPHVEIFNTRTHVDGFENLDFQMNNECILVMGVNVVRFELGCTSDLLYFILYFYCTSIQVVVQMYYMWVRCTFG
jgi:hypothetical protein